MNILSVENFNGYFTSQTSLWGSFHSTCDRLTYNFTPGVYVLSGEIDSGDGLLPLHFIRKVLKIQLFFLMRQRFIIWERKLLLKKFKSMPVILMMLQQAELKSYY